MTFDNEKQKKFMLQLIDSVNFSGKSLEEAYEFKLAVQNAEIKNGTLRTKK